jgi:predicted amidohydrolase
LKVGFLQFKPKLLDIDYNLEKIKKLIGETKADLIVLPELAVTGYLFCNTDELKKVSENPYDGKTAVFFKTLAKKNNCSYVVGFAELGEDDKIYNSAMLVNPEGNVFIYRKTHLFYEEKKWFTPGNTGFGVFDINGVKVGMMICFDWMFPESARSLALNGAQIIAHPSNLVLPWCQRAMFARSLENRVFSITANRIGTESRCDKSLSFTGKSQILSTTGEILAKADIDNEALIFAEINPKDADKKDINEFNNIFKDRRKSIYNL